MATPFDELPLLSRLLDEALAQPADRVLAWVDALPAGHAHLRERLRAMLHRHRERAHVAFLADGPRLSSAPDDGSVAEAGERVGPYRLIREIGRGGMGAVWLAERADGTLKRQVALKLPRLAWGARLAERMARERDIGARLEHPHIARLYDAGVDERGRPYLALEHVDGETIDAWCRARRLPVPDRLRLFLQVARAIAYAHGRLVVHRDLKPSNVLVAGDGRAMLLDFGIARLLHDDAPDVMRPTQEGERILTPLYASPEQLRGETITVASDVYALGLLLFELLSGRMPHEPDRGSMAVLEAARLDEDAPLASSRAPNPAVARALRGELDAILAKALQRAADDRYATADALADDIERHLAGERVRAQPDRPALRIARAWRRHRLAIAAATAVAVAVLVGSAVAIVQARRAHDAAERARVVKEFVIDLFKASPHGRPARDELRQLPVELLIERGAKVIESGFAGQPGLQAELYGVVGGIFAGMGADEPAATLAMRQLETQVASRAGPVEQAQATMLLAQALAAQGRSGEAEPMARSALGLAGADPVLRPRIQLLLAQVLLQRGQREEGLQSLDDALHGMDDQPALRVDRARGQALRAGLLVFADRLGEARPLYLAAIDDALGAEGPLSPTAIDIRITLANNLASRDLMGEAKPLREAALAALRASGGAGELRAALEESEFAKALFLDRRIAFDEAREGLERARTAVQARGALVPARIRATVDFNLGAVLLGWGDLQRALPLIADSAEVLRREARNERERHRPAGIQGMAAMLAGRHDEADAFFREDLAHRPAANMHRPPERLFDETQRALNRSMQRRFDEAEAILATLPAGRSSPALAALRRQAQARVALDRGQAAAALALLPATDDGDAAPYPLDTLLLRGEALCALGRHATGLALLERTLALHAGSDHADSPHRARTQALAGLCAWDAGDRARAAAFAESARTSLRAQPLAGAYFRAPAGQLDARLEARAPRARGA